MVEVVVRHWECMVAKGDGSDGRDNISGDEASHPARQTIRACDDGKRWAEGGNTWLKVMAALFYADNRMVASTRLVWIQTAFDTLTGLFDWVGLNTNI